MQFSETTYVGDSAGFKTFKNPVLTINDHSVGFFSDISLGHKIFSHSRIFVIAVIADFGRDPAYTLY